MIDSNLYTRRLHIPMWGFIVSYRQPPVRIADSAARFWAERQLLSGHPPGGWQMPGDGEVQLWRELSAVLNQLLADAHTHTLPSQPHIYSLTEYLLSTTKPFSWIRPEAAKTNEHHESFFKCFTHAFSESYSQTDECFFYSESRSHSILKNANHWVFHTSPIQY